MDEGQVSDQENVGPKNEHSGRIPGSKIAEKIKAMQSGMLNDEAGQLSPAPKPEIKLNVSVKNLALNLNINPLTLRVGAKPPKPRALEPILDLDKEANDVSSGSTTDNSLEPIAAIGTGTSAPTGATNIPPKRDDEVTDNFIETIKARVKIQQKRRPPSNRVLKSLPIHEEAKKVEVDSDSEQDVETANPMIEASGGLNPENSESEEKENVEPNKEKDTKDVDTNSDTLAAETVTGEPDKSRENVEEQAFEDPNPMLLYIIPFSIFRNLGWVITVAASLIILLLIPILLEAFINAKQGNLPQ